MRTISQSASKIADFAQCQRKYFATYLSKEIPFVETAETKLGKEIHSLYENIIKQGEFSEKTSLLNDDNVVFLQKLVYADGNKYPEFRFGISDLGGAISCVQTQNGWDKQDNKELFVLAGSMDLRIVNGEFTTVIDYKSGKDYRLEELHHANNIKQAIDGKTLQLDTYALAEFLFNPTCQYVKGLYYFTPTGKILEIYYERDKDFNRLYNMILGECYRIAAQIEAWRTNNTLPVKEVVPIAPTKLCGWCGLKDKCEGAKCA